MKKGSFYYEMAKKMPRVSMGPKLWNYLMYRLLPRRAVQSVRRYTPQIASLVLTSRCNLNCSYCHYGKILSKGKKSEPENEATLEKIKRIFSNPWFANIILVDLIGGEPLLVKELDRIIVYLKHQGRFTHTSTNGLLLADRILDLKRAGISRVNVSLYDSNRPILERNLAAINKIFPVHTSCVLLRSDLEKRQEKLFEMVRFVREEGCLSLRFFMYQPMGIAPRLEEVVFDSEPALWEFRRRVEDAFPGFCFFPPAAKRRGAEKRCSQLWQRIACDMSGRMLVCCGIDTLLEGPGSNLFEDGLAVYNHPTMMAMRKKLSDPHSGPPEVCNNCFLLGDPGW